MKTRSCSGAAKAAAKRAESKSAAVARAERAARRSTAPASGQRGSAAAAAGVDESSGVDENTLPTRPTVLPTRRSQQKPPLGPTSDYDIVRMENIAEQQRVMALFNLEQESSPMAAALAEKKRLAAAALALRRHSRLSSPADDCPRRRSARLAGMPTVTATATATATEMETETMALRNGKTRTYCSGDAPDMGAEDEEAASSGSGGDSSH